MTKIQNNKSYLIVQKIKKYKSNKKQFVDFLGHNQTRFFHNLESLRLAESVFDSAFKEYVSKEKLKIQRLAQSFTKKEKREYSRTVKDMGKANKISTKNKKVAKVHGLQLRLFINEHNIPIFMYEMYFVDLLSSFESFLRKEIGMVFYFNNNFLISSKKQISYEELLKMKSMDNIKDALVEKEISMMFRDGIENVLNYINEEFEFALNKNKDWKQFNELFYRRNIIVHNDGVADLTYKLKTGKKLGDRLAILTIPKPYLKKAYKLTTKYTRDIHQLLLQKFS
ncbi:MAG: hypothetical protein KGI00_01565 [Candidatus Micrarchaeota archaeon]|nr:hypothetical protein [Planctomycetota bacterium]MDE1849397.1 hypothetical protein [Candidatus Micrarchaeota archaeon]